jgi:hypothetical protein
MVDPPILLNLDLCRCDRWEAISFDASREFHVLGLPALVNKLAGKGRISAELSNHPVLVMSVSGGHNDLRTFFCLGDGSFFSVFL